MKVSSILATKGTEIISITPEETVREAIARLARHRIGALVVLDENGRLVGIISERDIVRHAAQDEGVFDLPVREVMTKRVVVGLPQDDLMSVANTMVERRFRHLPIMDGGKLVGIISIGDVMKCQRDAYRGEIDTLETQIMADEV